MLMTQREMTARDWAVDAAVMLLAFAFGCVQLMLTASSIIIPDLVLRQYLGMVNVVPDLQVFVGLAMTVVRWCCAVAFRCPCSPPAWSYSWACS